MLKPTEEMIHQGALTLILEADGALETKDARIQAERVWETMSALLPPHTDLIARAAVRERLAVSMEKHGGVCREAVAADIRSGSWDDGPVFFAMIDALSAIPTPPADDHEPDFRLSLAKALFEASYGMRLVMWSDETKEYWLQRADLALQAHASPREWQDIATAPKDGTWFIAAQDGETYPCEWRTEEPDEGPPTSGWWDHFNQSFEEPTLWTPPPARTALELG